MFRAMCEKKIDTIFREQICKAVKQARTQSIQTMAQMNDESHHFDDDNVYSVVPSQEGDAYGNNLVPENNSIVPNVQNQHQQQQVQHNEEGNNPVNHNNSEHSEPDPEVESERPDPNKKATKDIRVIIVQDLSGSMEPSRTKLATGVNEFVGELKSRYEAPCDFAAQICLITFAGDNIDVGKWMDIHSVPVYTRDSFRCNGTTPLWRTCKIALDKVKEECGHCTTAVYAFTDGQDNNSNGVTSKDVRKMIEELDQTKHTMLFIGSDINSSTDAESAGITRHRSLNPTEEDTPFAMRACTNTIARCVTGETQTPEFNEDDILSSEGSRHTSAQSAQSARSQPANYAQNIDDLPEDDNVPTIRRYQSAGGRR